MNMNMNIYCDLCVNKYREEMCRTCTRNFIRMTTDGAIYIVCRRITHVFLIR